MNLPLAISMNFTVWHSYESVYVHRPDGSHVLIGDFYGDPQAAVIDWNEKWVVVVGYGLILYRLREPFSAYGHAKNSEQFWETSNSPPDILWIEAVYQASCSAVRFVVAPPNQGAGLYELDVDDCSIVRLLPEEPEPIIAV